MLLPAVTCAAPRASVQAEGGGRPRGEEEEGGERQAQADAQRKEGVPRHPHAAHQCVARVQGFGAQATSQCMHVSFYVPMHCSGANLGQHPRAPPLHCAGDQGPSTMKTSALNRHNEGEEGFVIYSAHDPRTQQRFVIQYGALRCCTISSTAQQALITRQTARINASTHRDLSVQSARQVCQAVEPRGT